MAIRPFSYVCYAIIMIIISCHSSLAALPLEFVEEPLAEVLTISGSSVILNCQANDPQSNVQWYRNDQLWTNSQAVLNNHSLWIQQVNQSTIGKYQCHASSNNYTIVSRYAAIKWATIGEFAINMTSEIMAFVGHPLTIPCFPPSSNPPAIISFRNKGVEVVQSSRVQVLSSGSLFIANVTRQDRGKYKCFAKNPLLPNQEKNSGPLRTLVTVQNTNKLHNTISFTTLPRDVTARVNTDVVLDCVPQADPEAAVHWQKIDGVMPQGRYFIQNDNLVIQRVQLSDSGHYRCTITNRAGSTSATALLSIEAPPEAYLPPETKTYVGADIDLNCSVTGSAVTAVQWFQNGVKLIRTDFNSRIRSNYNHLYIRNVNKGDETIYQCVAFNQFGSSQVITYLKISPGRPVLPSSSTPATLTTNPSTSQSASNQLTIWPWINTVPIITFIRQESKTNATMLWKFPSSDRRYVKSFTIRFGIRANFKNDRTSDYSKSAEIQLIERIMPPVVVPYISHTSWIQSKAIDIYWTLRPQTITQEVITHYRLCYMVIDDKSYAMRNMKYIKFDNVGLYEYRLYGLSPNHTYITALQAINGQGRGKFSLFYVIKLNSVTQPTVSTKNPLIYSETNPATQTIIDDDTLTKDDLVIFTVVIAACGIVTIAAIVLIVHVIKKRHRIPQSRKGASIFQHESERGEEIQIVRTNAVVQYQTDGAVETSIIRNTLIESNHGSSSNIDKTVDADSLNEQSPAPALESELCKQQKFEAHPRMNSESEGKAAHVAEWMTNQPQQSFDHSDSFKNITREYGYTRTDRRRSSKRRSRRRRHRNYGQTDNRYSRRTDPNSHSEYYSYQSNRSKKYRKRTDGSSSSCNDKIPRSYLPKTNRHYDDQSEFEEPHITNNRLVDNRGLPSPTDTIHYEDRCIHPVYIPERQAIYDDRQFESSDHGRMHLHLGNFHPTINSNPLIHRKYCDGCNSSHAGGASSSNANHSYCHPRYPSYIADATCPMYEGDNHPQYAHIYSNSPQVVRVTIPSPKDSYHPHHHHHHHQQHHPQPLQQQRIIESADPYYMQTANNDCSPIEPTTTPAGGHGQLALAYSNELPLTSPDHDTNTLSPNNRQYSLMNTGEPDTDLPLQECERNYISDYDEKNERNEERQTDSIDIDNTSRRSRLSPPEADDYKRIETRT
ncbi:uncharacterized protein TRIADDRAFT_55980 [Trichoplax adhaerens]|uniref:Uncharacterized protein n=1 Tax=Trichoplax adhaerens TaxID=10228 RepID=B3RTM7_TRIAD|nr:predicted protein [Trichoplax adhaerens]EDV26155.1 predicted protein [Trichoplax adhaerens]|eukprot:XP_002112188.1 predicted protein [Trichoplax adhaerens]